MQQKRFIWIFKCFKTKRTEAYLEDEKSPTFLPIL
jgi:hypothetical protein